VMVSYSGNGSCAAMFVASTLKKKKKNSTKAFNMTNAQHVRS
jgi:hypothetical protein